MVKGSRLDLPVCTRICPRMLDFVAKFCVQISQVKTRFSLCVVRWAFRYFNWANSLKHFSHLNLLALVCLKTWLRKAAKLPHRFWQMKHSLNFRARSNWSSVRFLYSASSLLSESSDSRSELCDLACWRVDCQLCCFFISRKKRSQSYLGFHIVHSMRRLCRILGLLLFSVHLKNLDEKWTPQKCIQFAECSERKCKRPGFF